MINCQLNDNTSAKENTIITRDKETLHHPLSRVVLDTDGPREACPQMVIPNWNGTCSGGVISASLKMFGHDPDQVSQGTSISLPLDNYVCGMYVHSFNESWSDPNTLYVAIHGGPNATPHGHLDAGSFYIQALGQVWATGNPGPGNYMSPGYFDKTVGPGYNEANTTPTKSGAWHFYRQRVEGKNYLKMKIRPGVASDFRLKLTNSKDNSSAEFTAMNSISQTNTWQELAIDLSKDINGVSAEHKDYFPVSDTLLVPTDTIILVALTPIRANVTYSFSDHNGPMSTVKVTLSGPLYSISAGNAFFFSLQTRKNYYWTAEKMGYHTLQDSFYLETDTTLQITMELATLVQKKTGDSRYLVHPNPADDYLVIDQEIPLANPVKTDLVNVSGISVYAAQAVTLPYMLNLKGMNPGIYFLKIHSPEGFANQIIIVK